MAEHFHFTDRPPAAVGREDDSDSTWAEFQLLSREQQVPATPGIHGAIAPALQDLITGMQRRHRVCPKPQAWLALHAILVGHATGTEPPPLPPADAVAWTRTSSTAKWVCFCDHLRGAERHRVLVPAAQFLLGLREEEWHHADAMKPPLAA